MVFDRIKEMLETVGHSARVDTAFGEAREVAGKVVVPVARVCYGGGGGGGKGVESEAKEGAGGGGGMGVNVQPIGLFVITDSAERWVPIVDVTRIALAGCAVATVGLLTLRKLLTSRR